MSRWAADDTDELNNTRMAIFKPGDEGDAENALWNDRGYPDLSYQVRVDVARGLAEDLKRWHGRLLVACLVKAGDSWTVDPVYYTTDWQPRGKAVKA